MTDPQPLPELVLKRIDCFKRFARPGAADCDHPEPDPRAAPRSARGHHLRGPAAGLAVRHDHPPHRDLFEPRRRGPPHELGAPHRLWHRSRLLANVVGGLQVRRRGGRRARAAGQAHGEPWRGG
ncbi:hypothetical protein ISF_03242 [Cordyceps fumosorosea ARSEF 2679]|uniref:Uncharacterized protein n=1 Tax=Cordyceps fumosorosea (strain ARSEF 2679) TaxID=1081104 RepID=A0A168AKA1_CORFA|nr:hypothetical protein ISF_03242 [Cordyceps fumosorosea ARSEF 2679]OAA68867.1 hypothetical protein ISF_03242 [Cordyceps fumosorosea ARSEF 2679]